MVLSINTVFIASLAFITATAELAGWRPDLEWDELASKLSPTALMIDTSFADFLKECTPEFFEKPRLDRTNHALIDQPSGMCVDQLFCAYERCYPRPDDDGHASTTLSQRLNDTNDTFKRSSFSDLRPDIQSWLTDSSNPSLNLPSKVLFPAVASDIVVAIMFAKQHSLEISVKNSGHSYTGASTKRDTLHINMNRYKQYAPTGITDCDVGVDASGQRAESTTDDLSNQPCRLAVARGKPATIRVGGGENWDKTFRAVKVANEAHNRTTQGGGYKYHAVGGAAGTVSPMGWTFQGGLGGTVGGRMYGFGVDQILQVEMVLPNGSHVRFGPTEWEDASEEGFTAPRTTSVSGVCRDNVEELDEDQWIWSACPTGAGINFDDLWFAVSGGGGGTWGVVTCMNLQLHDYLPVSVLIAAGENDNCPIDRFYQAMPLIAAFQATYILLPSRLNIAQSESNACAFPDGVLGLACYGEGAGQIAFAAWGKYVQSNAKVLSEAGISAADVLPCFEFFDTFNDWAEVIKITDGPYTGRIKDSPEPTISSMGAEDKLNILIPKKWVEANQEFILKWLVSDMGNAYYAFGDGTVSASDQANSLSAAHRECGAKVNVPPDVFFSKYFTSMFNTSDKDNFPAILGANHAGTNMVGPRKDDWTKVCPKEWTQEERDEKCISLQESIFGTKTLMRLEAIKKAVDPNYMFDCNGCIGNNRARAVLSIAPSAAPSVGMSAAPSAAPSATSSSAHLHHKSCLLIFPIMLRLLYCLFE